MEDISGRFRWSGVELRHLVALKTIADLGSVAAAARALGYSQPAVSQQLMTLEGLVGARLVERQSGVRQVTLTDAGTRVLRHGAAILAQAQAADADLRALQDGTAGALRLGTIPSVGARVVPPLLALAEARAPEIVVELVEESWEDRLIERLEAGRLDLAFAFAPMADGPFDFVELMRDEYVLLVSADSPSAASKRPLSLRRLEREPVSVCAQSTSVEEFCRVQGIAAQIRYRIEDNQTLIGLVAAGLTTALMPRLAVDPSRTDVVEVALQTPPPARVILLAWHRDRELTPRAELIVELAQSVCQGLDP